MSRPVVTDVQANHNRTRFTLHHLTDIHDGSRHFDERAFVKRVAEIAADPNALWTGGGDYGDLIAHNDPRFQADMLSAPYHSNPQNMGAIFLERMTEMLLPIREKCVTFGMGNHETAFANHYHRNLAVELANNLGVLDKYISYSGWGILRFSRGTRRQTLKIYQWHGWRAGRGASGFDLESERELGARDADILLTGHDHKPDAKIWTSESVRASGKGAYIEVPWPRVAINGGCWLGPDRDSESPQRVSEFKNPSWASKKNFRLERVGGPILHIDVDFGGSSGSRGNPASYDFTLEERSHG